MLSEKIIKAQALSFTNNSGTDFQLLKNHLRISS